MAVFGSTIYKIFALKCQKLRTPLASLAPCVKICHTFFTFSEKNVFTVRKWMWKIVHQHCSSLMITLIKISNFEQQMWTASKLKFQKKVVASCLYLFLSASYLKFTRKSLKIVRIYFLPQGYLKVHDKVSHSQVNAGCQYLYLSASYWKFMRNVAKNQ